MKKHYSAAFKAKVVQEMLKEEKALGQLAAEYGVSTKQLGRWKTSPWKTCLGCSKLKPRKPNNNTSNKCKNCMPKSVA